MEGSGRYLTEFAWRDWRGQRKASVTTVVSPAEIRKAHLPNTSQNNYRLSQAARYSVIRIMDI
jgi:hypothetical protein